MIVKIKINWEWNNLKRKEKRKQRGWEAISRTWESVGVWFKVKS